MSQVTIQLHPLLAPSQYEVAMKLITLFVRYALPQLSNQGQPPFEGPVSIELLPAKGHAYGMTTGFYNPGTGRIGCRVEGRALVDVLRTVAHELVHQRQDQLGELSGPVPNIGGRVEDEANAVAGMLIKSFVEDTNCQWLYLI